jgi:hypothetical protein
MGTRTHRVVLKTTQNRIVGDLTLPEDGYRSRLSDFLNRQDLAFVSLTAAEITGDDGQTDRHEFLAVARDHIVMAYEVGE